MGLRTYTIQRNDTLWLLAQRYCTTVDTIRAVNPGMDPDNLTVGRMIWIPAGYSLQNLPSWFRSQEAGSDEAADNGQISACPEAYSYTIEAGDTLWLLSRRFQTAVEEIMVMNPGLNPVSLFEGQVICIPRRWNQTSPPPGPMQ